MTDAIIQTDDGWLRLERPVCVIEAPHPDAVGEVLADVERLTREKGYYAAGFVTYEAGAAFGLTVHAPAGGEASSGLPLACFGLYAPATVRLSPSLEPGGPYELGRLEPSLDRARFAAAFDQVKASLGEGDTYQANLTFRMSGRFEGDSLGLFADLVDAQRGRYSACLRVGDRVICSASPELFFAISGVNIECRPMKGTARRGRTVEEDRARQAALQTSAKERAENVMIVDMVRNDLGRIADVGTVEVPELFTVERYPTVWQMTSRVTARSLAPLADIFAALHPSASVTGAPKVRTTAILSALEETPRGVYTGAIGYVRPDGDARFNVAIRTAVIDERAHTVEFGVGSGIVWDSDASAEYDECLLKADVLGRHATPFELLETLRWTPEADFFLLERHLRRLGDSAEYFGVAWSEAAVRAALAQAVGAASVGGTPTGPQRVRLLLALDGAIRVERQPLVTGTGPLRVALAPEPVDDADAGLFHKTTRRALYDRARAAHPALDDVILWNAQGHVTEATTANVVVADGQGHAGGAPDLTPPVACGLLAGTYRAELLATGAIREAIVTIDDLRATPRFWLVNSVHGRREAVLVEPGSVGLSRAEGARR